MNQAFIKKLNDVLEENYQNENFGVSDLAEAMGISRSKLHRKLNSSKGISSSEFIRQFRLQKAYVLLKNDVSTVSEIAYTVGFSSPSYFTTCFQKHYNCPPSELKRKFDSEIKIEEASTEKNAYPKLKTFLTLGIFGYYLRFGQFKIRLITLGILVLIALVPFAIFYEAGNISNRQKAKSIAVLPLQAEAQSMDNTILSEGIHEGLSSSLGKINGLQVLSRSSTLGYKNSKKNKQEIIRELGVDFLVSGKIHYSDRDSIVLSLTIHKAGILEAGFQNFNYNTSIENIVTVQNEASKSIGVSAGVLSKLEYTAVNYNNRKVNKNAYKNYIRGMHYLHRSSQADFDKGIQYLYKAIDDDPAEPLAYAGLAYGYVILGHSAAENRDVFSKAKMAAKRAIQLDSMLLEAYASMASIAIYHDRNWKDAERLFEHLLFKNPSMANVHYDYAWYLLLIGNKEKAIKHHELAEKLDPFNVKYIAWTGWMYAYYGDYKKAMEKVETALRIAPNNAIAYLTMGFIYKSQNNTSKALEAYSKLYELNPSFAGSLGSLYAEMGQVQKANKILNTVINWPESPWKNWNLAVLHAGLNNAKEAVKILETEPKHAFVAWAAVIPAFDHIKQSDGFKAFVSGLNLPGKKFNSSLNTTNSQ
ncbi:helix-turn-helix domain-containing protein [Snuella sedimenti]|uniref:Helix-turn-helix domain-containing protein n=1 Tax=Snuella sedimenti TaxID=2798802 RepID=A0A8J7IHH3_9FLAO|nr:helix-turn-helix domain-containing protein [Snuella sedimenti]MBJ6368011.1 helix-turn-helix domain-containing protein [Snuella sedimenti]